MRKFKDRPYLLLTLAVLFWSGNFILGRAFHNEIPPVALSFWRWVGAALLVTVPALPHLRRDRRALYQHWQVILLLATLGIAAFNTLAYSGLQYTEAINAFLLQSLMPVLIVLLSFMLFRERVTKLQIVGILVSLCGAVAIIARGEIKILFSLSINRGDLLVFTAIVCYAGYTVMLRKRPDVHPLAFIATTFWLGSLIIVPFYLWETLTVATLELNPATMMVIGYVMVFPSIISYLCYNRGVELVGANRAGLFIHLMPVFGSLMAVFFLGEIFCWYHGLGITLIGLGIYLATRK
ncbi:MAG: DMT family transporter [Desulfuromonadales bacterium]|nr:DMT family transporter [Desulfuromonadales bacterium]